MIQDKDQALQAFEENRKAFLEHCRYVARAVANAREDRQVTIDDIRERVRLPDGMDGRVFGAVFSKDEWEAVGFRKSRQKINHGRPITVFKLKCSRPAPELPPAFNLKPEKAEQPNLFAA
jgi:hypothetical protein